MALGPFNVILFTSLLVTYFFGLFERCRPLLGSETGWITLVQKETGWITHDWGWRRLFPFSVWWFKETYSTLKAHSENFKILFYDSWRSWPIYRQVRILFELLNIFCQGRTNKSAENKVLICSYMHYFI